MEKFHQEVRDRDRFQSISKLRDLVLKGQQTEEENAGDMAPKAPSPPNNMMEIEGPPPEHPEDDSSFPSGARGVNVLADEAEQG